MADFSSLKNVKLLIMDVDGILSNTHIYLGSDDEWKRFYSIRDGVGIKRIQEAGYKTAIITGSKAKDVRKRAEGLGIDFFYEGALDKEPSFARLQEESGFSPSEMAYIGDEVYDIPLLKAVAFSATVPEAWEDVLEVVQYVTQRTGGNGAVREVCELILKHGHFA